MVKKALPFFLLALASYLMISRYASQRRKEIEEGLFTSAGKFTNALGDRFTK